MKALPSRNGNVLRGQLKEPSQKRKPAVKMKRGVLILWSLVIIPPFTSSLLG